MTQYGTIITEVGLAKIANAQVTQQKIGLEYIALGDGNGAHYVPKQNQSTLINEVWRGPVASVTIDSANDNRVIIDGVIPAEAGGFTIREVGIFDDQNQLIAVGQYPEKYKPQLSEGVSEETVIHFVIETNNADVVKLAIDPTIIIASRSYVDGKVAAHTNPAKTDAHKIINIEGLEDELSEIGNKIENINAVKKASGYHPENDANKIGETSVYNLTAVGVNTPPAAIDGWSTIFTAAGSPSSDRAMQFGQKWNDDARRLWYRKNDHGTNWGPWGQIPVIYHERLQHVDLNNMIATGKYYLGDEVTLSNYPTYASWGILEVETNFDITYQTLKTALGYIFYRHKRPGVPWSVWTSIAFPQSQYDKWNAGYDTYTRFQGECAQINDWNLATQNGMYMGSEVANAPSTDWFMGTVIAHNDSYIVQKVIGVTSGREFERQKYNGVWEQWIETSPRQLFQSVSNGKAAVANAITQKGVATSPTAEFATMASNIGLIGKYKKGVGQITSSGGFSYFNVSGLGFLPRAVLINVRGSSGGYNIPGKGIYFLDWGGVNNMNIFIFDEGNMRWHNYGTVLSTTNDGFSARIVYPDITGQFDYVAFEAK
ncbi:phage tail protein [Metasolibacillus meyeri]|uniref:Phage tail protein n=1 Tax=Metasolibacillus meyeri TaxID=1071052 RepID=A0AAW9NYB7_9BACL|nr:phage tail protein [Metasolibacillus meyeri]MEC1180363.1 phage tail protein [Metasolibacillus meyeri]